MTSMEDQLIEMIAHADHGYHHLILLVAASGEGKSIVLREVHKRINAPMLNLNLELSRKLLELSARQRSLQMPRILAEIVDSHENEVILLDNNEVLFDISLSQDPLRLLQRISRNKKIVAAWNGSVVDQYLTYAIPGHSEYRRYSIENILIVQAATAA